MVGEGTAHHQPTGAGLVDNGASCITETPMPRMLLVRRKSLAQPEKVGSLIPINLPIFFWVLFPTGSLQEDQVCLFRALQRMACSSPVSSQAKIKWSES